MGPPVTLRPDCAGLVAHHPEAVGAVHRPCPGGPERHLRLIAAAGARRVMHLPRRPGEPAAARVATAITEAAGRASAGAGCSTLGSARGAALRSGRESLLREEFLLRHGKDEVDSTVGAVDHLIGVSHEDPSNNDWTTSTSFARRRPGILPLPRGRPLDVVEGRGRERLWRRRSRLRRAEYCPSARESASHNSPVPSTRADRSGRARRPRDRWRSGVDRPGARPAVRSTKLHDGRSNVDRPRRGGSPGGNCAPGPIASTGPMTLSRWSRPPRASRPAHDPRPPHPRSRQRSPRRAG